MKLINFFLVKKLTMSHNFFCKLFVENFAFYDLDTEQELEPELEPEPEPEPEL
jgi:hypothetical protein